MIRVLGALALAFTATAAWAQPVVPTGPAPALPRPAAVATAAPTPLIPVGTHALTAEDVSAYYDGMIPSTLKRSGVAGAVVVVVRDGQVLFSKGYGYSDVAKKTPVDPATTLFRPGSVSKLFTWTAVMQQVEAGKLDLNTDINKYLDFKIPEAYGKPITLKNLMTHTPGFEESVKGLMTYDATKNQSLGDTLKQWVPTRIFPPGEVPAYSNYGAALAGYIVERVSGEPFAQYIQRHIFAPLAMNHSTFEQPLPKRLAADMSQGYGAADGDPKKFEIVFLSPAGALSAAGDDISHFMIAHLNNGSYNGAQILKPETVKLMHSMALQLVDGVPGMAYGFYHEDFNGHQVIGHGGDTQFFHSDLHLIVDENVGLYISMNSAGRPDALPVTSTRREFFEGFMRRYFPAPPFKLGPAIASARDDAKKVAGLYHLSRRSETNFLSLGDLMGQIPITINDDNTLSTEIARDASGKLSKYREVAPNKWQSEQGDVIVSHMKDGRVDYLMASAEPQIITIQPVSAWEARTWRAPAMYAMIAMLVLTVLFWPIKAILRRRYGQPFELRDRARLLYRLARVAALLDVVFIAGWAWFLTAGLSDLDVLSAASDPLLRVLQAIGVVGAVGTIAMGLNFATALGDPARRWWTKVTDGLLVLAGVAFVFFAFSYHLIAASLNY